MSKSILEHILQDDFYEKIPVIAIVGAGGKTTTALRLVEEFKERGLTPILTTTTHMMCPDTSDFIGEEDLEQVKAVLDTHRSAWIGIPGARKRIGAVSERFFAKLCGLGVPIIVEADGARMNPFKIPAEWEPVIPKQTNIVIGVMGLRALGCPIENVCYRPKDVAKFLEKDTEQCLEPEDYVKVGISGQGLKKHVSSKMCYHIVLSKTDDERSKQGGDIICRLLKEKGMSVTFLNL